LAVLGASEPNDQQPQQTGMLFIIRQQAQPAFIMAAMQSQQAWIMAQQSLSPLVQVMQTPFSIISHLHIPIIRLQQQTIIPFIIRQQPHMPPASIVQRFCIIPADILSSLLQVIFIPPGHFSTVMMQRGTIIMFVPVGIVPGAAIVPDPIAGAPMPGMAIPDRSIINAFIMVSHPQSRSDIRTPVETGSTATETIIGHPVRFAMSNLQKMIRG
jgi:hypothetical protein